MDFIKFSRGHFFGVIIPGVFLFFNIVLINNELISSFINDETKNKFGSNTPYFITIFLIISYILGILIRLLRPSPLEKLAFPLHWFPIMVTHGLRRLKGLVSKKPLKNGKKELKAIKANAVSIGDIKSMSEVRFYLQEFPYLYWFFGTYLKNVGFNYKKFYLENILLDEFNDDIESIHGKNFFNHCKIYVYEKSENISEEMLYNEGLSRFISGLIYSFIISIIMMIPYFDKFISLFYIYLGLVIFSLFQLRSIRVKEILAVFDAYMMIKSKESKE
jgi:hypothetical protein